MPVRLYLDSHPALTGSASTWKAIQLEPELEKKYSYTRITIQLETDSEPNWKNELMWIHNQLYLDRFPGRAGL